jgi:tetratricopeptide (TPR) repeat protein
MNLLRIIFSGYFWAMAVHYSSKGEYEKASKYLSKNEALKLPEKLHRHYIHTYILHAHIKKKMGEFQESLEYASLAKELLDRTNKIDANDIGYLQFYTIVISLEATAALGINKDSINATGAEYVLANVSKRYLDIFRLKEVSN